jgi:spore germination cell wall hydrolase CwlJ-like protein
MFWTCAFFVMFIAWVSCNVRHAVGAEFTPLTHTEPIVRMVLQEAANESLRGQAAVAGVALDRMSDSRWPETEHAVIYQSRQFTGMGLRLRDYSQTQITQARLAVDLARTGYRPCGRVLWYHAEYITPDWSFNLKKHCQIGLHIFYGD